MCDTWYAIFLPPAHRMRMEDLGVCGPCLTRSRQTHGACFESDDDFERDTDVSFTIVFRLCFFSRV